MNAPDKALAPQMRKVSQAKDIRFDGRTYGYVPPKKLTISPKLTLHTRGDQDLDPITYEVIRHSLWQVNEEHGATIQRISGSPVAMYALDLNPSILTEDAEFVYFGPYMQYMSGVTDTQVKWILEYRSDNPGIRDGDMFLANDPWVGAAHQQDVMLICPVFWKGELFCWVTNCLHQYDIGGITPSSFCGSAESAYEEGICIPPVKIVENNEIRRDIEEVYLRASRKPDAVALDFRAQFAGNIAARDRILGLCARYGAEVVKGVMRRILDTSERAFLEKIKRLPDGVWRDRSYVESCRPGDRRAHQAMLTLRKKGNTLTFENEGTAPQDGAMNSTYSGWRGALMVALNQLLCWDQNFAIGGALRHVAFDPTIGTFNCATFPASVSTAPVQAMEISLYPAYNVLSKMIFSDPEIDAVVICAPTDMHVDLIRQAVRTKKAVFCEKPVSHDPKKIDELIEEARKAGVPVQIGFNRRFDPNFLAVKTKILDGKIGQPRLIRVTSYDPAPPPVEYIKRSGGMLFDMTIHDFDMVRYLSGEDVATVYAKGANLVDPKIGEAGDIDTAIVTLSFKHGAIGVILNCRESAYGYDQRIEVLGSKGGIQAENVYPNTTVLSTGDSVQTEKPLNFFLERYEAAYRTELGQFFQSVIDKKEPSVGLIDVKKAILIAEAATESLKQGKPISL